MVHCISKTRGSALVYILQATPVGGGGRKMVYSGKNGAEYRFLGIFSCDSSSIRGNLGRSVRVNEFQAVLFALTVHVMIIFDCIMH